MLINFLIQSLQFFGIQAISEISLSGWLGMGLAVITLLFFLFRDSRIRKQYRRLEQELDLRRREITEQEIEISKQKKELQKQIEFSEDQNQLIHKQALELDKHRHSLEKKVELRTEELLKAKEKAEESDRLKTAFLENISHEIRTPMNAIIGFASLLAYPGSNKDEQKNYVTRINNNCSVLLKTIDGIIDVSKIQAGQMRFVKSTFSVNKLLQNIFNEFTASYSELQEKNIQTELVLPGDNRDFILYSDPLRVQEVLLNLTGNAVKYTDKGTIRLGYHPLFGSDYEKEPSELQFFVEDTGIGISRENTGYIFEWFNKIEDNKTRVYRGAGLGLYLSKEIIRLLGGKMWFNSKVNEGSTFYFTLPFLNTSEDQAHETVQPERNGSGEKVVKYDWRNKTILIVEDEPNNIMYLAEIIKMTGAEVLQAVNGVEALKIIEENRDISLVLMDIMMPEMDGYEATRKIKKLKPRLAVIAQTAYTKSREKEKSLEAGCDGYISKPYDPPSLLKLINNFL